MAIFCHVPSLLVHLHSQFSRTIASFLSHIYLILLPPPRPMLTALTLLPMTLPKLEKLKWIKPDTLYKCAEKKKLQEKMLIKVSLSNDRYMIKWWCKEYPWMTYETNYKETIKITWTVNTLTFAINSSISNKLTKSTTNSSLL